MSPSQQNGWLLRVQHKLCVTDKLNNICQRKWEKNKKIKKRNLNLQHPWDIWIIFFPTNYFSLLESCQLYIIAKYKASSCYKIEAVILRYSAKTVFLKISPNLQKNLCTRVSFKKKLQLKKRLWHRCFSVNLAKFLRTSFFVKHPWWLSIVKLEPSLWNQQSFSSSYFWLHLISCGTIVVKRDIYRKIFVVVPIYISIQASKHWN